MIGIKGFLINNNTGKGNKKYNRFSLSKGYGIGFTTKGEEFYFDLEDYDKIKEHCWHKSVYGYCEARDCSTSKLIKMHKLLLPCDSCYEIDHINRNTLDNRKINLRIVTRTINNLNQGLRKNSSSGVTGVNYNKNYRKWLAQLCLYGVKHYRYFDNFDDACKYRKYLEDTLLREK